MNFTPNSIPYQQTGYFSRLILDYLNEEPFLKSFYEHPVSMEGIDAAINNRSEIKTNRKLLIQVLEQQYASLHIQDAVTKNLNSLSNENCFTITTAHQPAIFTGNLYFIYKILHVIKIAETLSSKYKHHHFVPVFYMGSEDADLDELGHIFLDNKKLSWDTSQTGSVGRMHTTGFDKMIGRIEGEFSGFPFGPELIQLFKDCYQSSETIQEATLKLLNHLFGEYGLVVLIPDHRMLKSVMNHIFKDDLIKHLPFEIINKNIQQLSKQYPVQAKPREVNLFYLKDDIRERIDLTDNLYHVHKTNIRFTQEEILMELSAFPERFSPNVILRGIYQETILPNIAFVGGGGETAYWLELKPLFDHYKVPFPVLILRNSFLLIRKFWESKILKTKLEAVSFFQPEEKLLGEFVRENSNRQLNLEKEKATLHQFYDSLKSISAHVDKTLLQHIDKLETQSQKKLTELEKKILRAEKKNHGETRRRIHEIREALFPLNELQERIENFIPWYTAYGPAFIELLYKHSHTFEQTFTILEEKTD